MTPNHLVLLILIDNLLNTKSQVYSIILNPVEYAMATALIRIKREFVEQFDEMCTGIQDWTDIHQSSCVNNSAFLSKFTNRSKLRSPPPPLTFIIE